MHFSVTRGSMIYCLHASATVRLSPSARVKLTAFIIKINGYWITAATQTRQRLTPKAPSVVLAMDEDAVKCRSVSDIPRDLATGENNGRRRGEAHLHFSVAATGINVALRTRRFSNVSGLIRALAPLLIQHARAGLLRVPSSLTLSRFS